MKGIVGFAATATLVLVGCSSSPPAWSKQTAASKFSAIEAAYTQGQRLTVPPDSSPAERAALASKLEAACSAFVTGLRHGRWPSVAKADIASLVLESSKVCSDLAKEAKAHTAAQLAAIATPEDSLLDGINTLRARIASELGL